MVASEGASAEAQAREPELVDAHVATAGDVRRRDARDGFMAVAPLWPSTVVEGIAFALVCRSAGLAGVETQLLSLLLYAGTAQFAFADLFGKETGALAIAATVLFLNLRHVLYGLSINRWLPGSPSPPRALVAFILTDESFGLSEGRAQRGRPSGWFLAGTGLAMYLSWNLATFLGVVAGEVVAIPDDVGLAFVFPLSFVALTLPLIRNRRHVAAVVVAGGVAVTVAQVANSGVTVLAASLAAVAVGAALERGRPEDGDEVGRG